MKQHFRIAMHAAIASLNLAGFDAALAQPSFQGLGDLPGLGFQSHADGVSADGSVVVGWSSSTDKGAEAFRWTAGGGMVGLGAIAPGSSSHAMNVSRNGLVVVGEGGSTSSFMEAFRWSSPGPMVGLGFLSLPQSIARAASADGSVVVGRSGFGEPKLGGYHPFRWSNPGGMVLVGDLPGGSTEGAAHDCSADGTVIVGYSSSSSGAEAFRWTSATGMVGLGDLTDGGFSSFAYAVSADGSIVVGSGFSSTGQQAFRWTSAGMIPLGALPAANPSSRATDVSDNGSIIVGESNSSVGLLGTEAFIWDAKNGMRNLKTVLADLGLPVEGWLLAGATGVSANGQIIVGWGLNPSGQSEGWIARLPAIPADLNGDGVVNTLDLGILLSSWSIPPTAPACGGALPCPADINGDGFVNTLDLGILLSSWQL